MHRTGGGSEKMRIKAFVSLMDESVINRTWEQLRNAILEIQKKNNSGLSFEELYRNAYNMVLQKHGERLYAGTRELVREHMFRVRDMIIENLNNKPLTYLNACWKDHQTAMVMIRDVLMYMDRVYVAQKDHPSVYKMGISAFCELVVQHSTIRDHLRRTLLDMIERERRGQSISRSEIRETCQMYVQLGVGTLSVYVNEFETPFLTQSRKFYAAESEAFLSQNTSSITYIREIGKRIEDEKYRVQHYLDSSTESKIVRVLEEELISRHLDTILGMENSGLTYMLTHDSFDDIAAMYKVLNRVEEGPKRMAEYISVYLREKGQIINRDTNINDSQQYIQHLITLRDRANKWLTLALDNDSMFRNQINSDFIQFINLNNRSPELLSLFIDDKLTRGTKGMADQDLDTVFDMCIVLFRYLQDKDIFERYYKKHLARRLLWNKSQSDDQENVMISKLKAECGTVYTNKLEGMFKDMEISKTLMKEFNEKHSVTGFDLNVRVLTSGQWPSSNVASTELLPTEVLEVFGIYRKFYLTKHSGRRITVQNSQGHAELSFKSYAPLSTTDGGGHSISGLADAANPGYLLRGSSSGSSGPVTSQGSQVIPVSGLPGSPGAPGVIDPNPGRVSSRKYILQVSTYQMIILLAFNRSNRFTFAELANETNISDENLRRSLIPLALNKPNQRVLCKEPKVKEIGKDDVFFVNESFSSKHNKIKFQSIQVKETEEERGKTNIQVDENRKYVIEAAIVRVMKLRKTLAHSLLVAEVIEQLRTRFQATPVLIKQRIETLIEREFLARTEDDRRVYKYLA